MMFKTSDVRQDGRALKRPWDPWPSNTTNLAPVCKRICKERSRHHEIQALKVGVSPPDSVSTVTLSSSISDDKSQCYPSKRRWGSPGPAPPLKIQSEPVDVSDKASTAEVIEFQDVLPPGFGFHYRSVYSYENMTLIGEGSYGKVFKARNRVTEEQVAVKEITVKPGQTLSSIPEIKYLSECNHRNIVRFKEIAVDVVNPDAAYIVMEYAEHDLKSAVKRMPWVFNEETIKSIMGQLLKGIAYLHGKRILHRDIKTANILVDSSGTVKICDLGLATSIPPPHSTLPLVSRPGRIPFGTPYYCAPELLDEDTKDYSAAVDVWSAGCVMGEMLGGDALFQGWNLDDQLDKISDLVSVRCEDPWQTQKPLDRLRQRFPLSMLSQEGYDLLSKMLMMKPERRITPDDTIWHPWFSDYRH